MQFFTPQWTEQLGLPTSSVLGRAVGMLRQPNLQATLVIWGVMAAAWLAGQFLLARRIFGLVLLSAMFTVAMTGSRTAMVLTGLLLLWGWLDRSLPRLVRIGLAVSPLLLLASLMALKWWAQESGGSYFVETRAQSGSDISSSRFAIWSNTLDLIRAHPWTGLGWGNFNFAWTLTDFEQRPVAFFDHTHNLVLQLAVELGIPAAVAICGVFLWLSWRSRGALSLPDAVQRRTAHTAFVMLVAVLFHSLLEYPLWYPYFLLPSAFLWGLYLGLGWPGRQHGAEEPARAGGASGAVLAGAFMVAGVVTVLASLYAIWDYQRVSQIFAPRGEAGARPLQERIREGQKSHWFGAHADYAAVTTAARPSEVFEAFERPLHTLIDVRLMIAYAKALHERGERDKAVYVAQRLREFRHPLGDKFFAVCKTPPEAGKDKPFQCETEPVRLNFRDFESDRR